MLLERENRGGRPPKDPDVRRSQTVHVRLTRAEYAALELRAASQTLSDFIRAASLGQAIPRRLGLDPVIAHDLRQIARRHPDAAAEILALLR